MGVRPEQLSSAAFLGLRPLQPRVGASFRLGGRYGLGGIPCSPSPVFPPGFRGRIFPAGERTCRRVEGSQSRRQARPDWSGSAAVNFACPDLPCPQTPHSARCIGMRRPMARRKPRISLGPILSSHCRAWACTSSEPGPLEAWTSSPGPGRSTTCPSPAGARRRQGNAPGSGPGAPAAGAQTRVSL